MTVKPSHIAVFLPLGFLMAATRSHTAVGALLHLHDASWAIFFVAGFCLADQWRWAFPALMLEAVGIDYAAVVYLGVGNYCVTAAYWFLVPAYAALWLGGRWLRERQSLDYRGAAALLTSSLLAISACFLISNGSFYWLGGRVAEPTWSGWVQNFSRWYWPFLQSSLLYIAVIATVHVAVLNAQKIAGRRISRLS